MPPIWVHFGLSLAACAAIGTLARRHPGKPWLPWIGYGLVIGAVAPDADLILSSLATAFAGFDTDLGKDLHRTFTHSIPLVAALLLAAAALWSRHPRAAPALLGAGLGVAFLHMLPDLFYLVPLKPLAPFSLHEVGPLGPIDKALYSDAQNNVINGIDFLGESLSMLAVWWLARRARDENRLSRTLPWLAGINAAIFLPLTLFVAPRVSYDDFLIWAYAPGLLFIVVVTVLVPWRQRNTFLHLGGAPTPPATAHAIPPSPVGAA